MTMRAARPGAPSHLRVAGDPATIVTTALVSAVSLVSVLLLTKCVISSFF